LRVGEEILNHANKGETTSRWKESLSLPGSVQIGHLSAFFQKLEWWRLKPAADLLREQPGDSETRKFISVARSNDRKTIVVYLPKTGDVSLYNLHEDRYEGQWFDAVANKTTKASISYKDGILTVAAPSGGNDHVLVLNRK
jgi:hypothetical protein